MKFSDLLLLPYDKNTGIINLDAIMTALPETPESVAQQVYADHGRKSDFQSLYGDLDIAQIHWSLHSLPARELIASSMNPEFNRWLVNVSERATKFSEQGWRCIDVRPEVQSQWAKYATWLTEPIFLSGRLVRAAAQLHLVEGHTRVGLLRGLTEQGIIAAESMHKVWIGNA